ncbi:MAG TPA: hypothetical protein VIP77_05140 [Jiangellaceae bacterium]
MAKDSDDRSFRGIACPRCGHLVGAMTDAHYDEYFRNGLSTCDGCQQRFDPWTLMVDQLRRDHPYQPGIVTLGFAAITYARFSLGRHKSQRIALSSLRVPADARLARVMFNSDLAEGGFIRAVSSEQVIRRDYISDVIDVYGVPMGNNPPAASSVLMRAIWIRPHEDPEMEQLVAAAEAFSNRSYRQVVLSASVAVEEKLFAIMSEFFVRFGGKDRVDSFLRQGATYGHQVGFMLPALMSFTSAPPMPEKLRAGLAELKRLRNKVAHKREEITIAQAAGALVAATFGYWYLKLYGPLLLGVRPPFGDPLAT